MIKRHREKERKRGKGWENEREIASKRDIHVLVLFPLKTIPINIHFDVCTVKNTVSC